MRNHSVNEWQEFILKRKIQILKNVIGLILLQAFRLTKASKTANERTLDGDPNFKVRLLEITDRLNKIMSSDE